jgi:hypothetical protein
VNAGGPDATGIAGTNRSTSLFATPAELPPARSTALLLARRTAV